MPMQGKERIPQMMASKEQHDAEDGNHSKRDN